MKLPKNTTQKKRAQIILRELKKLFPISHTILHYTTPWELLVAVILSAQTSDQQVNVVTRKLFQIFPRLENYVEVNSHDFERHISGINYYKTKARHIIESAHIIHKKYNGIIPKSVDEMMQLPGVGRKTALVVLGNVYGMTDGIAVDTHVRRLSRVFGLSQHTQPEKIEKDLLQLFPRHEWFDLTNRLIAYGRAYCPASCNHHSCPILHTLNTLELS